VLLTTVAGLRLHTWYVFGVGAIGMLQNAVAATGRRDFTHSALNLAPAITLSGGKVMDALMDFESAFPGHGLALVEEFFPGHLNEDEKLWWYGNDRSAYNETRVTLRPESVRQLEHVNRIYGSLPKDARSSDRRDPPLFPTVSNVTPSMQLHAATEQPQTKT
jgi:hypothetical protein